MAQARLREMGSSEIADHPYFLELMKLALDLGGTEGLWTRQLVECHVSLVNSKIRRVSLGVLAACSEFPKNAEAVRNAVIQQAYRGMATEDNPTSALKEWLTRANIAAILTTKSGSDKRDLLMIAEKALRRFHLAYPMKGAYDRMTPKEHTTLMATVDGDIAQALFTVPKQTRQFLLAEMAIKDKFIRSQIPGSVVSTLPDCYVAPVSVAATGAKLPKEKDELQATIIQYSLNSPITSP